MARKNRQIRNDLNTVIESCLFDLKNYSQDYLNEDCFRYEDRIYRLLYYLERVQTIVEFRELVTPEKKIRNILYNIKTFESCENEN